MLAYARGSDTRNEYVNSQEDALCQTKFGSA
jgi:hypothetical protein